MQNTIQLPQDLYETVRKQAKAQQKTTDSLVAEWVSARVDETEKGKLTQLFQQEIAAFEKLKPTLFEQYADQYVAIYQGEVVANGDDKLALLQEVRDRFGHIVCYIEQVTADSPRTARLPSVRLAVNGYYR